MSDLAFSFSLIICSFSSKWRFFYAHERKAWMCEQNKPVFSCVVEMQQQLMQRLRSFAVRSRSCSAVVRLPIAWCALGAYATLARSTTPIQFKRQSKRQVSFHLSIIYQSSTSSNRVRLAWACRVRRAVVRSRRADLVHTSAAAVAIAVAVEETAAVAAAVVAVVAAGWTGRSWGWTCRRGRRESIRCRRWATRLATARPPSRSASSRHSGRLFDES